MWNVRLCTGLLGGSRLLRNRVSTLRSPLGGSQLLRNRVSTLGIQVRAGKSPVGTSLGFLCIIVCSSLHMFNCTGTNGIDATHDFVLGAPPQCLKYACELHNIEVCGGMKYKDADAMAICKLRQCNKVWSTHFPGR